MKNSTHASVATIGSAVAIIEACPDKTHSIQQKQNNGSHKSHISSQHKLSRAAAVLRVIRSL